VSVHGGTLFAIAANAVIGAFALFLGLTEDFGWSVFFVAPAGILLGMLQLVVSTMTVTSLRLNDVNGALMIAALMSGPAMTFAGVYFAFANAHGC
jgi:hypothetical protein